ncbi:MAG: hypothetical protein HYV63_09110, partial [Candidatus Schekmanbacteria bacterium]|nr:hypothetical protein [Candidatus Schekmanbacteria bacterium]
METTPMGARTRTCHSLQDNVWKEILDAYLEQFLSFFFPKVHADIDWS